MSITFSDISNIDIAALVGLCDAPSDSAGRTLITPPLDELLDSDDVDDDYAEPDDGTPFVAAPAIQAYHFTPPTRIIPDLVVAVDSGIITLGEIGGGGLVFAIRGAAVCQAGQETLVLRYRTGALLLTPENRLAVFRHIGSRLGTPDLYVREDDHGHLVPQSSVIETANQATDRCRNFVERIIQEEALGLLAANGGGLLLLDGALAVSYDTPKPYLERMCDFARDKRIDISAISKRSRITIGALPVDALFDPYPIFVGFAPLLGALERERDAYEGINVRAAKDITMGTEVFAVRFGFGPPALTFRVDVSKSWGSTDADVINDVYERCQLYGGYPRLLIDAHQYSAFLSEEKLGLLADVVVRTGMRVKDQPSMGVLFQPFGAFGK